MSDRSTALADERTLVGAAEQEQRFGELNRARVDEP